MDGDALRSTAVEILAVITTVAATIATLRGKKNVSDTDAKLEAAKQSSVAVYIDQLDAVTKALAQERADRIADAAAARDREADLRTINDQVRSQFAASLNEFRASLSTADHRAGVLIEDVAEWRGRAEALQAEKIDLQAAVQSQRSACNEEKRALTAGYERQISSLNSENHTLADSNRRLTNQLYGDGTATNIMGPAK